LQRGCEDCPARTIAADHDDLDPGAQLPLAESHTTAKLAPTTGAIEGMFNQALESAR
jgi:hypothetical protein